VGPIISDAEMGCEVRTWDDVRARLLAAAPLQYANDIPQAMLDTLVATCAPSTQICVAADLTLATETIASRTVTDWKKAPAPNLHKRPAIFLLLAN
jgi:hypothetical protein